MEVKNRLNFFVSSIRFWGGSENRMFTTATGLHRRGHEVTLICQPGSKLEKTIKDKKPGYRFFTLRMDSDINPCTIVKLIHLMKQYTPQIICVNVDKEVKISRYSR